MSCPAKVSIKVKKTTTDTIKKDKYVKVRIIILIDYNIIAQFNMYNSILQLLSALRAYSLIICSTFKYFVYYTIFTYINRYLLNNLKYYKF